MRETFQFYLQQACLALLLAILAGYCIFCVMKVFGRCRMSFALILFSVGMLLYAGGKTNIVLRMVRPMRTLSFPVLVTEAQKMIANWNARGAYDDSLKYAFDDNWEFPSGTKHLSAVEIAANGVVYESHFSTNIVVSSPVDVSIIPGVTKFSAETTASGDHAFRWRNAGISRNLNDLIDIDLELRRNGDRLVAANGVETLYARELPFDHDGWGQDDAWVAANFTNLTEIAAAGGYAAWVDSLVGHGLTNGLYKLTVAVADTPPETIRIGVGDFSVAITNSGDYVFLLKKGISYALSSSSRIAENFAYSAVDDVPAVMRGWIPGLSLSQSSGNDEGVWSGDSGELVIDAPDGRIEWLPQLRVLPPHWRPSSFRQSASFKAHVFDIPDGLPIGYQWISSHSKVTLSDSNQQTMRATCHFPFEDNTDVSMSLTAMVGTLAMHSYFSCTVGPYHSGDYDYECNDDNHNEGEEGENLPNAAISISPKIVFRDGNLAGPFPNAQIECSYTTDCAGLFALTQETDPSSLSGTTTWSVDGPVTGARHFTVSRNNQSADGNGTVFKLRFAPDGSGTPLEATNDVVFAEYTTSTMARWPQNDSRKVLGVREEVTIYLMPSDLDTTLSKTSVDSILQRNPGGWGWQYTAPQTSSLDGIMAADGETLFSFSILEPTGYGVIDTSCDIGAGTNVAGNFTVYVELRMLPNTVNFEKIQIYEVPQIAYNPTGFFALPENLGLLDHGQHGAGRWIDVKNNSRNSDTLEFMTISAADIASSTMTWPTPNNWRIAGESGSGVKFCDTDQTFTLESDGDASISKFGKTFQRLYNSSTIIESN